MFTNKRNLLWFLPLLLMLSAPLWQPSVARFLDPGGDLSGDEIIEATKQGRRFIMDSIVITLSNHGRLEWVIDAERAYTGRSDLEIGMNAVDALYLDKNGDETVITSNRGTYRLRTRHLTLIDDVVVRVPAKKEEMTTELLDYYDAGKMVISPVPVRIKSPDYDIHAGRMDYDLATDAYDLSENVTCDF